MKELVRDQSQEDHSSKWPLRGAVDTEPLGCTWDVTWGECAHMEDSG